MSKVLKEYFYQHLAAYPESGEIPGRWYNDKDDCSIRRVGCKYNFKKKKKEKEMCFYDVVKEMCFYDVVKEMCFYDVVKEMCFYDVVKEIILYDVVK